MAALAGTGFRPRRTIPRTMCLTEASGWSGFGRMASSLSARTRGQSVFDAVEEDRLFTFGRLSKGDDSNISGRLGMHNGNDDSIKQTKRHKALLGIVQPIVFKRVCDPIEDARSVDEIQTVVDQIGSSFGFAPREAHIRIVYTPPRRVKSCLTSKVTGGRGAGEAPPAGVRVDRWVRPCRTLPRGSRPKNICGYHVPPSKAAITNHITRIATTSAIAYAGFPVAKATPQMISATTVTTDIRPAIIPARNHPTLFPCRECARPRIRVLAPGQRGRPREAIARLSVRQSLNLPQMALRNRCPMKTRTACGNIPGPLAKDSTTTISRRTSQPPATLPRTRSSARQRSACR